MPMRRINTDEAAILRLFDDFASGEGLSLQDAHSHETFIARVSATLAQLRSNPIAIHETTISLGEGISAIASA